jgi:hypothetical protein
MKPRKLSSRYIDSQIAQIHEMHDRAWNELASHSIPEPDEHGQIKMSYKALRATLKNRAAFAHVGGFWAGWSLAKGDQS